MSRAELARRLGMQRSAISRVVSLITQGLVCEDCARRATLPYPPPIPDAMAVDDVHHTSWR
jgi:hypothetical protein